MKSGILPINKPEGISSARVVSMVKQSCMAKKTGHMGTLDPFATGLLLCGINKGTKISRFFLHGSKRYKAKICLGIETDTFDYTGTPIGGKKPTGNLSKEKIFNTISDFKGKQKQTPPSFSALKHKGRPLYEYARNGEFIAKKARDIEIFEISIDKIEIPFVHIDVSCSSGTYIRTIAFDIGQKLGCGAHLGALQRTETCGFNLKDSIDLNDLEKMNTDKIKENIIPLARALDFMPAHTAEKKLEKKIQFGQKLSAGDGLPQCKKFLRILTKQKELAAVVEYDKKSQAFNYCCVFLN